MEINQNLQFVITREFGKDMIAKGSGKVIFTASLLTFQGGINILGYAASNGVQVNAIAPRSIATDKIPKLCEMIL